MVLQYPHTITITPKDDPVQGSDGNFVSPSPLPSFTSFCRVEPYSKTEPTISASDGRVLNYNYVVYMPLTSEVFEFGDEVEITLLDGSMINGYVKQHSNGQFNSRLWV